MVFGLFQKKEEPSPSKGATNNNRNVPSTSNQAPGFRAIRQAVVLITGSSGLCGARLVEMCLERGAQTVVAVDVKAPSEGDDGAWKALEERYGKQKVILCHGTKEGDITSDAAMEIAFAKVPKIDMVFHLGGLTGPFFDRREYVAVNYEGTRRVIDMCRQHKVPKLIFAGTPSTRFTGADIQGQKESDLPMPTHWLIPYAESKALAEQAVTAANNDGLSTLTVAPHQVYGPADELFLPKILQVAGKDQLHIFGKGDTTTSVTYVDNYVHGLLCGADALCSPDTTVQEKVAGGFYIVTDDHTVKLWDFLNNFIVGLGFPDLHHKVKLPAWLLYSAAYVANAIGAVTGRKLPLSPFNVKMLTMHRYFDITRAKQDLQYTPIVQHDKAVAMTLEWYKTHWLPSFLKENPQHAAKQTTDQMSGEPVKTME